MKKLLSIFLFLLVLTTQAKITATRISGNVFRFHGSQKPIKIQTQTRVFTNSIITTDSKGIAIIDFNDEVIGTVYLAPNTQVVLRVTKTDGIRLLSLIKGNIQFKKDIIYKGKKPGLLINIRDNDKAYYGDHFEIHYTENRKVLTSFKQGFRTFSLAKSRAKKRIRIKKATLNSELTDQELQEDLKFLLDSN